MSLADKDTALGFTGLNGELNKTDAQDERPGRLLLTQTLMSRWRVTSKSLSITTAIATNSWCINRPLDP